jgi:hypothetical protein
MVPTGQSHEQKNLPFFAAVKTIAKLVAAMNKTGKIEKFMDP